MAPLPPLLLITDRHRTGRGVPWAVRQALSVAPAGTVGIMLREKDLDGGALLRLARELRDITAAAGATLIVNARSDIAIACEAEGVHLGGDAPRVADVRARFGEALWIGASIHGTEAIPRGASYGLLSPIFPTLSKPGASPLGLDALCARAATGSTPIIALGGVNPENACECLAVGASGVATLGGVLTQSEPARSMERWLTVVMSGRPNQA